MSRTTALSIVAGLLAGILATPAASAQQKDIEAQLQRLLERFPDADANKDGKLTAAEAMAYRKAMVGKSGGGRSYSIEPDHAAAIVLVQPRNHLGRQAQLFADDSRRLYGLALLAGDKDLEMVRSEARRQLPGAPVPLG